MQGVVRDLVTGETLGGVSVYVCGVSVFTDAAGRFGADVPPGECLVRAASAELVAADVVLTVVAGGIADVTVWCSPAETVVATYGDVPGRLDAEEVKDVPGMLGDPVRALSVAPGLTRTPLELGWLLVRGGEFDHVSTFVDGVRVPTIRHLGGYASVLHPALVRDVRLDPAPSPPRYGDALAGMAEVRLRKVGDVASASVGANVVFANAAVEVPIGDDAGFFVAGRRSYLDVVLGEFVGEDAGAAAPRFWDGLMRADYRDTSLTALVVADTLVTPTATGEALLVVRQSGQSFHVATEVAAIRVDPWFSRQLREVESDVDHEKLYDLSSGLRVEGGTETVTAGFDAVASETQLETVDAELQAIRGGIAPYMSAAWGAPASFSLGLRLDDLLTEDQPFRWGLSPSAGLSVPVAGPLSFRSELGRSHRAPRITVVMLPESATLPLEQSDAVSSGFVVESNRVTASVDGVIRTWDFTAGVEPDGSAGASTGSAVAVESEMSVVLGPLDLHSIVSLTSSARWEDPSEPWVRQPYDQPVRVDVLAVWHAPWRLILSGRFRFSTGTPYPSGLDPKEQVYTDVFNGETFPLPAGQRLPNWYGIDVQVRRGFVFRHGTFDAYVALQNLTNHRVPEPGITGFGEPEASYGLGLPILPIVGFDVRVVP